MSTEGAQTTAEVRNDELIEDSERTRVLFGGAIQYDKLGDTKRFGTDHNDRRCDIQTVLQLLAEGHIEPQATQNSGLSIIDLIGVATELKDDYEGSQYGGAELDIWFGGYMVDPNRSDSRITLNSIRVEYDGPKGKSIDSFEQAFKEKVTQQEEVVTLENASIVGQMERSSEMQDVPPDELSSYEEDGNTVFRAWWD